MIEKALTKTQREIIYLFYRFRFLTRSKLQTLLNHKSDYRVREWLNFLVKDNYLTRIDPPEDKLLHEPAIYFLNTKSISVLKENKGINKRKLKKLYSEKERTEIFINTCLKVVDVYLHFLKKLNDQTKLYFYTQEELNEFDYLPEKLPTCYVSIEGRKQERYFIEIIPTNTYKFILKQIVDKYTEYFDDGDWQEATGYKFPTILLLCADPKNKRTLDEYIKENVYEEYGKNDINFEILDQNLLN